MADGSAPDPPAPDPTAPDPTAPDPAALGLDPDLLEILACPAPDHGPLLVGTPEDAAASALTCTVCDRRYPVTDGIPVLLISEASGGDEAERSSTGRGGDEAERSSTGGSGPAPSAAR